uniref:Uncharacterized protein n=1 Tax=Anguilla anguilla TaxID=7936 RepID=A0A0E9WV65_ANGAN
MPSYWKIQRLVQNISSVGNSNIFAVYMYSYGSEHCVQPSHMHRHICTHLLFASTKG